MGPTLDPTLELTNVYARHPPRAKVGRLPRTQHVTYADQRLGKGLLGDKRWCEGLTKLMESVWVEVDRGCGTPLS